MSEPIRLLHFADLHVGMENYGRLDPVTGTSSRVRDFLERLEEVIGYALEHEADLVIFAGDAFKNREPDPTQQREFAQRIKRLADQVPTLLLVGNHDMPGMAVKASAVDIFQALAVPGVIVGHKNDSQVVKTRRGPVFLAWMPYPMRNRLLAREENQGKTIDELEQKLRAMVADILGEMAREAERHAMPRVLAGHFSVAEARLGSERTVMLGRDVAVMTSTLADPAWDYVALGHIHRHQDLNAGAAPPVVYSGSLERIDFGEEREDKGFCWVELERGAARWQFIPVRARAFRTLQVDARTAEDPTSAVVEAVAQSQVEGAVVRVQVRLRAEQQASFREAEIHAALSKAASVSIAREVETDARARLGNLAPEALTPLELLARYFESRQVEPDRARELLAHAEDLLRDPD
jgi:DNA repair protein SbcD/Mre11